MFPLVVSFANCTHFSFAPFSCGSAQIMIIFIVVDVVICRWRSVYYLSSSYAWHIAMHNTHSYCCSHNVRTLCFQVKQRHKWKFIAYFHCCSKKKLCMTWPCGKYSQRKQLVEEKTFFFILLPLNCVNMRFVNSSNITLSSCPLVLSIHTRRLHRK